MPPVDLLKQQQVSNIPEGFITDLNELRNTKLFIATPMYSGICNGLYTKSILDLQTMLNSVGIESRFSFLFNESLITRARAYLSDEYLRATTGSGQPYTHMLFIDSDIEFDPRNIIELIQLNKEIIGIPYVKKTINWGNIKEAIKKNPDIPNHELEQVMGEYVFNPIPGTEKFSVHEPLEVMEVGTGMMMIKREVFGKFKEAYPEYSYKPDHIGQANFDGSREIHMYFDTIIDPVTKRYLSEDYFFCQMCRKIGIKIWYAPWGVTSHQGTFSFRGNLPAVAQSTGKL